MHLLFYTDSHFFNLTFILQVIFENNIFGIKSERTQSRKGCIQMNKEMGNRICSVARTIEVIGDRWMFLIIREAFFGIKTYENFQRNLGIATNILSDRLKTLVQNDIFKRIKNPDDGRRFVYKLTEKGLDLYSIVLAIMNWGDRWLAGGEEPPLVLYHENCGHRLEPIMKCAHCGESIQARHITYSERPRKETKTLKTIFK